MSIAPRVEATAMRIAPRATAMTIAPRATAMTISAPRAEATAEKSTAPSVHEVKEAKMKVAMMTKAQLTEAMDSRLAAISRE